MKKVTLLCVVALGTIALASASNVNAAQVGGSQTTDGIIKMKPGGDADILPKDPGKEDDTKIDPKDYPDPVPLPGDPDENHVVKEGDLAFTKNPKVFNFGTQDVSAKIQAQKTYTAKALNQDIDAAKTPFSGGIQTLQVYDGRPAGSNLDNWQVAVKATTFTDATSKKTLDGATIHIKGAGTYTRDKAADLTVAPNLDIVTDNITTSTVFGVAQGKQAKEHSNLTWKAEDVELEMAGSQAKVGTFESVVTWTLTDAAYK
ncbi:hypothetical protein [Pseudolactococcus laudensis]|uniref:hypothetical protein n=1 Tax=Pseudolactococcus laudensis TaxID=1494461 RepID=UPI002FC8D16C